MIMLNLLYNLVYNYFIFILLFGLLRPPGLMDKALPSGGKDSEFESWGGRFCP